MHFLLITGPPAVGKMTVAQAICQKTGFKMFHNHQSIEVGLTMFDYGDPEFGQLNEGIRQLIFKTVAQSKKLKGFIFTLVMGFELEEDWDYIKQIKARFIANGWQFHIAELEANQATRLKRNNTPNRLEHKPSKRNLEGSSANLVKMDVKHRMNSKTNEFEGYDYCRINNEKMEPHEVADAIIEHFKFELA